jgi:hypothetical protein
MRLPTRETLLLNLLLLLTITSLVHAREYHVDPNHRHSSDSNSGAISQPWKSLHEANTTLQPGDTVYIHEGRYSQRIAPVNSGDASGPIVYQAWNSDDVHLAENLSREACIDLTNRSYIFIKHLNIRFPGGNYPAYARMMGAQHCRIEDCDFSGSKTAYHGILLGDHNADRPTSYNVFRKVSFKGCSGDLVLIRGDAHHNLFQDCYFSDVESWDHHANLMIYGLQPRGKSPCFNVFVNCEFVARHHSAANVCCGAHHNVFDKCTLRNADKSGNAMQMAASDNIFRRCLAIRNKGHIGSADTFSLYTARDEFFQEGKYYTFSVAERNRIYHNTFADNLGYAISCNYWPYGEEYPYGIGKNIFLNNIFVFNGADRGDLEIYYSDNSGKIGGDLWLRNVIGTESAEKVVTWKDTTYTLETAMKKIEPLVFKGNIQTDPLFRDREKDDYRLLPDSPCIDKARPLTQTTSDGSGVSIPVQDSRFFFDGFGIMEGDRIVVGRNQSAQVVSVPDDKRLIVAEPISWQASDPVSLPYEGAAPDIGAFEYVP